MIARLRQLHPLATLAIMAVVGILFWLLAVAVANGTAGAVIWLGLGLLWMLAWIANDALAHWQAPNRAMERLRDLVVPAIFGITLLFLWQLLVKGLNEVVD